MIDVDKIEGQYFEGQQIPVQSSNQANSSSNDKNRTGSSDKNRTGLDLANMRLALGSEMMVKEHSSVSTPSRGPEIIEGEEMRSSCSSSIFEQNPFKDFTNKKCQELLQQENQIQLIKIREQALEKRSKAQCKLFYLIN